MPSRPLGGKTILITGASSGIGRAAALLLAREGALLALAARRVALLESLAREIQSRHGQSPLVLPADVSRPSDIASMIKKTRDHFGRLDVLINNAGVLFMEPFLTMPVETMQKIMDTNFWSIVHAVREAAPYMTRQGGGHVVNVGSGVSRRGLPFMAAYTATKFALAGLTESLRLELGPQNIRFTAVYPGGVDTEMPNNLDRSKLPVGYRDHSRSRISAERAARAIVRAVRKQPLEVYVPWWVRQASWISVLIPRLADFLIKTFGMPKAFKS